VLLERITKEFYQTGTSFDEFLQSGTEEEQDRMKLYYQRLTKNFPSEKFRIDLTHPVYLLVVATTWCWDSKTNVPVFVRIAEQSPNVNLKIFNKDQYPFLVDKINRGEKIPQVLVFSQDFHYLDRWVERTTSGYQLYGAVRKEYGWDENEEQFLKEYRKRYLKQQKRLESDLIHEIKTLFTRVDAIQAATGRFFKK